MTARELYQAGRLDEAIRALGAEVRDNPTDARRRTFLFELLCFAGEFDRAEKHLNVLADGGADQKVGALLLFSALHAERLRRERFEGLPTAGVDGEEKLFTGTLNGEPFQSIADADPRLGARLELFAAGAYLWIPFEHIVSIEIESPKKLRDLLWLPALVRTGPAFQDKELGEVLIPLQYPMSYRSSIDAVRLGNETHWEETDDGTALPLGRKLFLVDGEEYPVTEIRSLVFAQGESAGA